MANQTFKYEGRYEDGRPVAGEVEASSKETAVRSLKERGITTTRLKGVRRGLLQKEISLKTARPVSRRSMALFTHQLATMISSGVPLERALLSLAKSSSDLRLKQVASDLAQDVESGMPLSDALEKHPKLFNSLYVNLVRAGETSGNVDETLLRIVENMERLHRLSRKLRKALLYPMILIFGTIGVILFMVTFVIPRFVEIYDQLGTQLPGPTQVVVEISQILRPLDGGLVPVKPMLFLLLLIAVTVIGYMLSWRGMLTRRITVVAMLGVLALGTYGIILAPLPGAIGHASVGIATLFRFGFFAVLGIGVWVALKTFAQTPSGRWIWDQTKLRIPAIGVIVAKVSLARFATTLSVLTNAGVDIQKALGYVAPATGNAVLEQAILRVRRRIDAGLPLSEVFKNESVFPDMMIQMIAVSEDVDGGLATQLTKIAGYYEDDVDDVIENIDTIIEPLVTVLMGLVIGTVLITMYLPIVQLFNDFGRLIF